MKEKPPMTKKRLCKAREKVTEKWGSKHLGNIWKEGPSEEMKGNGMVVVASPLLEVILYIKTKVLSLLIQ